MSTRGAAAESGGGEARGSLRESGLRVAVVPPVPALLPEYAGLTDPVAELRAACQGAVAWLLDGVAADPAVTTPDSAGTTPDSTVTTPDSAVTRPDSAVTTPDSVEIWADSPEDRRVGEYLLTTARAAATAAGDGVPTGAAGDGVPAARRVLLLANGSARRSEKAPGHLDERAAAFDEETGRALATGDAAALAALDLSLAAELLTAGTPALARFAATLADGPAPAARVWWSGDPYGVQYWVATWAVDGA